MNYRPRYLETFERIAAKKGKRRPIAAFDMETRDGTLLGKIGGIAFTSDLIYPRVERFSLMLHFLEYYLRKPHRGYVAYAHKGMSFDISHLLADKKVQTWLLENGFSVVVDRSFAIIRKKKHSWYLGDSLRIFPEKLDNVLKSFVPERTKAPLPKTRFSWNDEGWIRRIVDDTLGLYEALKRLENMIWETFNSPLSLTTPATALRAARVMLPLKHVRRPPRLALDWLRAGAYSGGRIEIFQQGEIRGNIYCFDINSAYAHAMMGDFPLGAGAYANKEPASNYYIGRCEVSVPVTEKIPPVLSRLYHHAFLVGTFQAMLTKEEVDFARECGATVTVIECWTWKRTKPMFRDFIQKCMTLRKRDYQGPLGKAVKLMQNGLYGILGMNPYRRVQCLSLAWPGKPWIDAYDYERGEYIPYTYEALLYRESPNQMPHWAAIITARVRVQLTRYLRLCTSVGLSPLYAHTDSIWLTSPNGIPKEISALCSDKYGALKLDKQGGYAVVVAPGEAVLQNHDGTWHVASKGWRGDPKIFTHGVEQKIQQVQIHRAGTAMKSKRVGRTIYKHVMSYSAMRNRHPAAFRPGRTIPRMAVAYDYAYWTFDNWYAGKLLRERPDAKANLLTNGAETSYTKDAPDTATMPTGRQSNGKNG